MTFAPVTDLLLKEEDAPSVNPDEPHEPPSANVTVPVMVPPERCNSGEHVTASVLAVEQSPERFPFVIELAPENAASSPEAGVPVVVTVPLPPPPVPTATPWT